MIRQLSLETPRKCSMIFDQLKEDNTQHFCAQAVETIAENILYSIHQSKNSPFFNISVRRVLDNIVRIGSSGSVRSAISLALLLHLSKAIKDRDSLKVMFGLFVDLEGVDYDIEVKLPSLYEKARQYIDTTSMRKCLLKDLKVLDSDLDSIIVRFVDFPDSRFRGWCAPGMVIINVRSFGNTMHLLHHVLLAVLIGHEMRYLLERKHYGNDFNHSTLDSTIKREPALIEGHREAGLWFDFAAIGGKFRFNKADKIIVDAIEAGFAESKCPALNEAQVQAFEELGLTLGFNDEATFEYVAGFVFD